MPWVRWGDGQLARAAGGAADPGGAGAGRVRRPARAGRPLPGAGEPYDENWWIRNLVRRENLAGALSPALALRKESEDLNRLVADKPTEESVRAFVEDLNERIREARRTGGTGPMLLLLRTHDVEKVVAAWRRARADRRPGE